MLQPLDSWELSREFDVPSVPLKNLFLSFLDIHCKILYHCNEGTLSDTTFYVGLRKQHNVHLD